MFLDSFQRQRLALSYFFAAPALVYGLFTSRLPALKLQTGADDAQIGVMLFCLGCATLAGLLACGFVLDKLGARLVLTFSTLAMSAGVIAAALAPNFYLMACSCLLTGFAVGFCDVSMNAQGIFLEKAYDSYCLSFLHAISSLGGVFGSLLGSLCAGAGLGPFANFALALGIFLLFCPFVYRALDASAHQGGKQARVWAAIPAVVWLCAILSLTCHVAEGSAAEWGSLLLHGEKGASQHEAALVFAVFTGAMVASRLMADRLRVHCGDILLVSGGGFLGAAGMAIVLLSPWPLLCLCGYALMGAGLGPVVPILFSRAGANPDTTPAQASAVVSVFSYAGLLFFPPFLGMLGSSWGIGHTLWLIPILCLVTGLGAFLPGMRQKSGS